MDEMHMNDILHPTSEREPDLQAFRHKTLAYWATVPEHHQSNTRQHKQIRINAAAHEITSTKGEPHLPGSYRLVTGDIYRVPLLPALLPVGASILFHTFDGSWWLDKIKQPSNVPGRYVMRSSTTQALS